MKPRLFIDISQFVAHPLPTGIQRTLLFLTRYWPEAEIDAEFGFIFDRSPDYKVLTLDAFRSSLEGIFKNRSLDAGLRPGLESPEPLAGSLSAAAHNSFLPKDLFRQYDGYLLPEHTFREEVVDMVYLCHKHLRRRCFAIVYDALPQTHPQFFWGPHQGGTDRFFFTLTKLDSLAFISQKSRRVFEERLRRSPVPNALVFPLGADVFGREANPAPNSANFLVVGTVEPRKLHRVIMDAFDRLWESGRDYHLTFLGSPGWVPGNFIEQLYQRSQTDKNFHWIDKAADDHLLKALQAATGLIFVSELEGYGLPPLEALALGCPVIVSERLPSLEGLPGAGQIRLASVTEETVAAAADRMADPAVNAAMRENIKSLDLPTWRQSINDLAYWIKTTIDSTVDSIPEIDQGSRTLSNVRDF